MKDINTQELEKIHGGLGFLATVAAGILIGVGVHVINNWDDFMAGLAGQKKP